MRVKKKIYTRADAIFFNQLNFLNKVYTYRTNLTAPFFVEKTGVLPLIV